MLAATPTPGCHVDRTLFLNYHVNSDEVRKKPGHLTSASTLRFFMPLPVQHTTQYLLTALHPTLSIFSFIIQYHRHDRSVSVVTGPYDYFWEA